MEFFFTGLFKIYEYLLFSKITPLYIVKKKIENWCFIFYFINAVKKIRYIPYQKLINAVIFCLLLI